LILLNVDSDGSCTLDSVPVAKQRSQHALIPCKHIQNTLSQKKIGWGTAALCPYIYQVHPPYCETIIRGSTCGPLAHVMQVMASYRPIHTLLLPDGPSHTALAGCPTLTTCGILLYGVVF